MHFAHERAGYMICFVKIDNLEPRFANSLSIEQNGGSEKFWVWMNPTNDSGSASHLLAADTVAQVLG